MAAHAAPVVPQPQFQAPPVAQPSFAPPPAPKSKLQEMLPLILILMGFAIIVLMVLLVFAWRSK